MKYTELKRGMLVEDLGLIIKVDFNDKSKVWGGPNVSFYCYHDSHYGPLSTGLHKDKIYKILHKNGSKSYKKAIRKMLGEVIKARVTSQKGEKELKGFL